MLTVIDFSSADTRPVPSPYMATFRWETFGEDASCATNDGYMIFHWEEVAWRVNREFFPALPAVMDDPEEIWAGVN